MGSVNLLLSPANPFAATGRTPLPVDPPEMANSSGRVRRLVLRAATHGRAGDTALFYFCGHGVAQGFNSLPPRPDYGADPALAVYRRPDRSARDVRRDRDVPCEDPSLLHRRLPDGPGRRREGGRRGETYLPEPFGDRDYRLTRSAAYDQSAYGQSNMVSVFTDALLDCLRDGLGVDRRREDDAGWVITTESLRAETWPGSCGRRPDRRKALPCDTVLPAHAQSGRPSCTSPIRSGSCRRSRVYPKEAGSLATLTLSAPGEAPVNRPAAGVWEFDMPAGPCDVSARFLNTLPGHPHAGASGLSPRVGGFPSPRSGSTRRRPGRQLSRLPPSPGPRRGRRLTAEQP